MALVKTKSREEKRIEPKKVEEAKRKYTEKAATLDWIATVDKYPGSVTDYCRFKGGEEFEEIDIARFRARRTDKLVQVHAPTYPQDIEGLELLTALMNSGECVGFVHYVPFQLVGSWFYVGGYGVPIRRVGEE